jgi:hypothetical protein
MTKLDPKTPGTLTLDIDVIDSYWSRQSLGVLRSSCGLYTIRFTSTKKWELRKGKQSLVYASLTKAKLAGVRMIERSTTTTTDAT